MCVFVICTVYLCSCVCVCVRDMYGVFVFVCVCVRDMYGVFVFVCVCVYVTSRRLSV